MLEKLNEIEKKALEAMAQAKELQELNELKVKILGRKGEITLMLRGLKDLSPQERSEFGQAANQVKDRIEKLVAQRINEIKARI